MNNPLPEAGVSVKNPIAPNAVWSPKPEKAMSVLGHANPLLSRGNLRDVEPEPKQETNHVDRRAIQQWQAAMANQQNVDFVREYGRFGATCINMGFEPAPMPEVDAIGPVFHRSKYGELFKVWCEGSFVHHKLVPKHRFILISGALRTEPACA